MRFFICGSALTGQPDHKNLGDAKLLGPARTAAKYRLHSVKDGWHPGIYAVDHGGISILGEVYELTTEQHAKLMAGEPPDMYQATIEMEDGSNAEAMLFPRALIEQHGYPDISHHGGWAAYKAAGA
ncbi:MAG TPA: gamma-glutamylcyclotransferase [Candidatus Baltobacteraceae bacterium]|nr:gamma-glutamylcyclotransferase [Candidatus Baltobacteraceae bacterium]